MKNQISLIKQHLFISGEYPTTKELKPNRARETKWYFVNNISNSDIIFQYLKKWLYIYQSVREELQSNSIKYFPSQPTFAIEANFDAIVNLYNV